MVARSQTSILNFVFLFFVAFAGLNPTANATGLSCAQLFTESKTVSSFDSKLVKGVIELGDKAEISQAIYDEFSVNEVARAIVKRVSNYEDQVESTISREDQVNLDLKTDTDILLFFYSNLISSIEHKGFLNQHLSGSSKGLYSPSTRRDAEDGFTGIKMGATSQSLKLRPKSAFLNIHANVIAGRREKRIETQYGDIAAVLKDEIKSRSLWTAYDSLELGRGSGSVRSNLTSSGLAPFRGSFDSKRISKAPHTSSGTSYYEALIYGEIDFNDVKYFLVTQKSQVESLKQFNKPIFILSSINKNDRIIYEKGELLFAGSSSETPSLVESTPAKHEAIESSPIHKEKDLVQEYLSVAGIKDGVVGKQVTLVTTEEFNMSLVTTESNNYRLFMPNKSIEKFNDFASEIKMSLRLLDEKGFKTKKIIHSTDQFIIQEGRGTDTELSEIPASSRKQIVEPLKQLILKMVENKLYLKGLRPSMISIDSTGELVIRGHDGLREKESVYETVKRFEEKLLPHWEKYFDQLQIQDLKEFLKALKEQYRERKAS